MNATPPVLPAFIPDAGAAAAAAATQSTPVKSDGPTFAGTLRDVGAKAGRRVVAAKAQSGEAVPPAGNAPPPAAATPPAAAPPLATKPAAPLPDATVSSTSGKAPDKQMVSAASAPAPGTDRPPAAAATASATVPIAGQPGISLPGGVAAAGVTAPGTAPAPTDATGNDIDAAPLQAPAVAVAAAQPAAAASGAATGAAGGKPATAPAPLRQSFKAALQHPAAALKEPADTDAGDDAQTSAPSTAADASTAAVTAGSATSPAPLAADASAAVALAALAESRDTSSTAAADAGDAPDAAGASAVAGATLTDAAIKGSANAAVQATLLQGGARADKHTIDAVGTGAAGTSVTDPGSVADAAAGISLPGSNAAVAPDTAPTPTVRVAANVDSAEFPHDLSSRVSWMVDNNMNGAKLQVNPPSLGPIELRILVSGDHAQVWMSSHSAVTRDALESSTPKLREMLGTQGFSQVSVDISQRSFQERSAYSPPYEQTSTAGRSGAIGAATVASTTTTRSSLGIVDAYA